MMTKEERTAWNAAVMLHHAVQQLRELCETAGITGQSITDDLRKASDAAFHLMITIEGKR